MDPDQLGGLKENSVAHYLIEIPNFILYNQDLKEPQATISAFIDIYQGFNRIRHATLIEVLSDMNVLGWLLRVMVGYLSERKLRVKYKGCISEEKCSRAGCLLLGTTQNKERKPYD